MEESKRKIAGRGGPRPNSGGKRLGAGRKTLPASQKRVAFPSRISPETLSAIKANAQEDESIGEVVDRWAKFGHNAEKA